MSGRRINRDGPNPSIPRYEKMLKDLEAEGKKDTREYKIRASILDMMKGEDHHRPAFIKAMDDHIREKNRKVAKDVNPK